MGLNRFKVGYFHQSGSKQKTIFYYQSMEWNNFCIGGNRWKPKRPLSPSRINPTHNFFSSIGHRRKHGEEEKIHSNKHGRGGPNHVLFIFHCCQFSLTPLHSLHEPPQTLLPSRWTPLPCNDFLFYPPTPFRSINFLDFSKTKKLTFLIWVLNSCSCVHLSPYLRILTVFVLVFWV